MTRIAISGAGGRMGRALIQAVAAQEGAVLAAAIERPDSSLIGADSGELAGIGANGIALVGSLETVIDAIDVLIDFTAPAVTIAAVWVVTWVNLRGVKTAGGITSTSMAAVVLAVRPALSMARAATFSVPPSFSQRFFT